MVSRAPGDNDNASGIAAILEIARILFSIDLKYTIRFVLFSGEEQGLRGSEHYADAIMRKNEDLS
jgi:Zn-dependent M28 family amino/carboxypeptidase